MRFVNQQTKQRGSIAVSALVVLALASCAHAQQPNLSNKRLDDHPVVIRWSDHSVMSQADHARLGPIMSGLQARHTITDADLTFVLNKLKSQPVERRGDNKLSLQCMVLSSLIGRKDFTKPQVDRFLQAVVPFAYSANSTVAGYAALALGSLRNARVIPILEKIAQSTKSQRVRRNASMNLPRLKQLAASGAI